jgi:hypothetical protein
MCDLNRVSGFLLAAKIAFIAIMVALGIALANNVSLFAAAANIGLMIGVIAGAAVATGAYAMAVAELDKCAGTCDTEIRDLRDKLMWAVGMMAALTALLIGLTVCAALPYAGAIIIGGVIAFAVGALSGVLGLHEILVGNAISSYNACRAAVGNTTISNAVVVFSYLAAAAGIAFSAGGFLSGKIPLPKFSVG